MLPPLLLDPFNNGWQSPYGEYSHVQELVLPVDEDGLVIDYPTLFQRLSPETI